jgi:uncharacterized membrane protein
MIKSLTIIAILSFLSGFIYFLTKKFNSKIIPALFIFLGGIIAGKIIPLSASNIELLDKIILNLSPATVFLYSLDFDIKTIFKNSIGCSCKMGAKKYWILVLSAFIASFVSQVAAEFLYEHHTLYISLLLSFIIGYLASFTKLKEVNGSEDIATTMLYLLSAVLGMRIFEGDYSL